MNKIILVLLVISLSIFALFIFNESGEVKSVYSQPAPQEGYGDINGDGVVSYDVNDAHKHDFWLLYAFEDEYGPWDVNEDGITNGDDVQEIQKFWTGAVNYSHLRADINWDDRVDVMDIWYVLKFFNETKTEPMSQERIDQITSHLNVAMLSPQEIMYRGDVDGDGALTEYDVYLIIQYAMGAIDKFPVQEQISSLISFSCPNNLERTCFGTKHTYDFSDVYTITLISAKISYSSFGMNDMLYVESSKDNQNWNVLSFYPMSSSNTEININLPLNYKEMRYIRFRVAYGFAELRGSSGTAITSGGGGVNLPPVALLDKEYYDTLPYRDITFDASASYDPDGKIVGYRFVIRNSSGVVADSGFITSPTFTYRFPYPSGLSASYSLILTVKDDDGATANDTAVIEVYRGTNQPPVAILSKHEYHINFGDTVTFDASQSYDPEGLPIKFNWYINMQPVYDDFGDYPTFTYTFDDPDIFDKAVVSVKVKDLAGDTGYDHAVVHINRTIYLNLTWQPEKPSVGDTVYFDASGSYVEGATITAYAFSIDDSFVSGWKNEPYYRYTFYTPGEHKVTLSVKINDAFIYSKSWNITVISEYTEPTIIVEGDLKVGSELRITVFYPFKVDWINIYYGDGDSESSPSIDGNQYTFTHTYKNEGVYTINASAHFGFNQYAYVETTITIRGETPPSPDWWLYITIGIVVAMMVAIVYVWMKRRR